MSLTAVFGMGTGGASSLTRAVVVGLIDTIKIKKAQDENSTKAFDITINYKFGAQKEIEPTVKSCSISAITQ